MHPDGVPSASRPSREDGTVQGLLEMPNYPTLAAMSGRACNG